MKDIQGYFDLLKEKLQNEGLFNADLKKPIPQFPQKIGVMTAPDGAAVRDIFSVLKREDQEEIASYYVNVDANQLGNYLSILSNYRNLCAHEDILYNHESIEQEYMNIVTREVVYD